MKKKQEESEGLRLVGAKKDQQTTDQIDTQVAQDHTDQGQGQDNPDSQEQLAAVSGSTQEQVVFSELNLIPFVQEKGEEVPYFSTFFMTRRRRGLSRELREKTKQGDNQA